MKRLKQLLLLSAVIPTLALSFVGTTATVSAVDVFPSSVCNSKSTSGQKTTVCQQAAQQTADKKNPVITALSVTISIMSYIIGVSAVIVIIVAGIRMVTSGGDAQSFGKARRSVVYALVALGIVAIAQLLVAFVLSSIT